MLTNHRRDTAAPLFRFLAHSAVTLAACTAFIAPAGAATDATQALTDLIQRFTEAQRDMDAPTLKNLTAENYIEISPLGEVDPREKMLSFYVKDDKRVAPAVTVDETQTRLLGTTAVVIARVSYSRAVDGPQRTFSLRSVFVAEKAGAAWKLVSAQYTPIRPKNPG
jgi:ketosteroid isomerase-like protein